jgi:hypothetical protein
MESCYITLPLTFNKYCSSRKIGNIDYDVHQQLSHVFPYNYHPNNEKQLCNHPFFPDNPRTFVSLLAQRLNKITDAFRYIITCYETYPILHPSSTASYNKKALGDRHSVAFSICDQGALSPITALHWLSITNRPGIVICLEQIYDYKESRRTTGYWKKDALSIIQVSPTEKQGDFKLLSMDEQRIWANEICTSSEEILAEHTSYLINRLLSNYNLSDEVVTIIPHCYGPIIEQIMKSHYPNVYLRKNKANLSTADPFYTLAELYNLNHNRLPYVILTFNDPRGHIGGILLEDCSEV